MRRRPASAAPVHRGPRGPSGCSGRMPCVRRSCQAWARHAPWTFRPLCNPQRTGHGITYSWRQGCIRPDLDFIRGGKPSSVDVQEARSVLGVKPDATLKEVKVAYRRLVLVCHPDRGSPDGGQRLRVVGEAYNTLKDVNAGSNSGRNGAFTATKDARPDRDTVDADPTEQAASEHAHKSDSSPVYAEYGVAIGAFTMEDISLARRSRFSFRAKRQIEVDPIGPHRRDDAALAAHSMLRSAARKEAIRTGWRQDMSGGLMIREGKGGWRWITRLEVTGIDPPPPGSYAHIHVWVKPRRRRRQDSRTSGKEIDICRQCGMSRTTTRRGGRVNIKYGIRK